MIEKALVEKYGEASDAMGDLQSVVLKLEQAKQTVESCQDALKKSSDVVGDSLPMPLPMMPAWMTAITASLACFHGTGLVRVVIERASDGIRYEMPNMTVDRREWFGQVALVHAGDKVQLRGGGVMMPGGGWLPLGL